MAPFPCNNTGGVIKIKADYELVGGRKKASIFFAESAVPGDQLIFT